MRQKAVFGLVVAVLLLAAGLRFFRLDAQSFWNDEGNSARLSERSLALIVEGAASDIHPPLYYLMLRAWREPLGDSEFALRAFSAFTGLLLVAVTYRLGADLAGRAVGLGGVFLAAVNPALVYYSQETRMYGLLALWAVLALFLLQRWLRQDLAGRLLAVALLLTNALGLYTHYFFPVVVAAQGLCFLWWLWRRRTARPPGPGWFQARAIRWAAVMLAAGLVYLPWLPIFLRQAGGRATARAPLPEFLVDGLHWLSFGSTAVSKEVVLPLLALISLLVIAWLPLNTNRTGRRSLAVGPVTFVGIVLPIAFMWLAGTTREPFFKFMLVAVPFVALAAAAGAARLWTGWTGGLLGRAGPTAAAIVGLLTLAGTLPSLQHLYFDPAYARADYRAAAALIAAEEHPNAAVILNAANQWEVFTYYHREGAPVFPLPRGYPEPAAIESELVDIAGQVDRIYALFWGEAERDPQRLVERWLDAHAFKARDQWLGDVRFVTYAVPQGGAAAMETRVDLRFGEAITLLGYTLGAETVRAGDILPVTLFWQTNAPVTERYKLFLHLVRQGEIVAQRDSEPGGGLNLTTIWPVGETVIDNHGLLVPLAAAPGEYELFLGMYELTDPAARLAIHTAEGPVDALRLAVIRVP